MLGKGFSWWDWPPPHTLAKQRPSGGSGAFRDLPCLLVGTLSAPACIFPQTGASDSAFSASPPTPISPLEGALQPLAHLNVILGISRGLRLDRNRVPEPLLINFLSLHFRCPQVTAKGKPAHGCLYLQDSLADPNVSISSPPPPAQLLTWHSRPSTIRSHDALCAPHILDHFLFPEHTFTILFPGLVQAVLPWKALFHFHTVKSPLKV